MPQDLAAPAPVAAADSAPVAAAPGPAAAAEPPVGTPAKRPPARRDPYFDNAKYLTIVLVACGHAWEPLTHGGRAATAAYLTVYAFHMPAFALISGFFSRSFDMGPGMVRRLLTGVVVPYLVFETAYSLLYRWAGDDPDLPLSLLDPGYAMWFLVALFIWRLTTPLWLSLRHAMPIAMALAVFAAVSPNLGGDISIQRVLGFLPFFVLGLKLRAEHFARLRTRRVRMLAVPVVVAAFGAAYAVAPWFNATLLYHSSSVTEQGLPRWAGLFTTPVLFLGALVLTACFLAWVPGRRWWFTALGAGTMYGYLLHVVIIKASRFWDWYDHSWLYTPLGQLAVTAVAVGLITVLCSGPIRSVFRFVVEPRMSWLFHDRTDAGKRATAAAPPR
ncbi:acyltransferase family protein [Streptomyces sporangiiformans]|uniref:Acyltransferase 3 domain-containing protein n=1 Tax=Streptomyces sporangiiformans TaxID=2315329 RepID=A0A505DPS2_9ACTN|nr:acyltransferase family protein [Streptomyces sporangiiformans]TPQ23180.1 hypothetical protein FGD71_005685 [Streptomyces sporangiiformans]